jgi:hypothetical protein
MIGTFYLVLTSEMLDVDGFIPRKSIFNVKDKRKNKNKMCHFTLIRSDPQKKKRTRKSLRNVERKQKMLVREGRGKKLYDSERTDGMKLMLLDVSKSQLRHTVDNIKDLVYKQDESI